MIFREATGADLPGIVGLLTDDPLGATRESADLAPYIAAFEKIAADPNNILVVGESDGRVAATYQLTVIPGISLAATTRAQIEGVRVARDLRGQGAGRALLEDVEARARQAGAGLLQLTMNRTRDDAHRFYTANGFTPSHVGFKKPI